MERFDICIIGAGVVGLAIARLAPHFPSRRGVPARILLLEQENGFGFHTSSRNSEVIHAGIYYPPDSLKATLCLRGRELLYDHCNTHDIPYRKTGKLILAQRDEFTALERLFKNAVSCGVDDLQCLDRQQLLSLEPVLQADAALLSPSTGIIDSHAFMQSLLHQAESQGVLFAARARFAAAEIEAAPKEATSGFVVTTRHEAEQEFRFHARWLINSAGLDAARVAGRIAGVSPNTIPIIHLCKGDYFSYGHSSPFSHLVYPVPNPSGTGLGIHGTLDMGNRLRFGPDAHHVDELDYAVDAGKAEIFRQAISRYFPRIRSEDLQPAYAGIRPRLGSEGFSDFMIQDQSVHGIPGLIQLYGIESPGLTASLAIAERINALIAEQES